MIKKNKWKVIISSLIILLPIAPGLILWDRLPEQMAIHWGIGGEADGWSSPAFAVFFMPCLLLAIHWLCLFATGLDKKQAGQNPKALGMIFWILPFTSLFASGLSYASAFGYKTNVMSFISVFLGILFLVIGNYLPKCKQNLTLGIKIKWTLANEENWNATHRFGGKVWMGCGILFMLCAFLPAVAFPFASIGVILLAVIPPFLYSYLYYKKQLREGTATRQSFENKRHYPRWVMVVTLILVALIVVFCLVITFTGNISFRYEEASFTVEASYYKDVTVAYADITALEYREENVPGERIMGFGSARLSMGQFENQEFGRYTRYTYTSPQACVILTLGESKLVLSGHGVEETRQLYDELTARVGG